MQIGWEIRTRNSGAVTPTQCRVSVACSYYNRWCASDVWHLSVAYIGPKSRTERPRKIKIGSEVAHVTWLGHQFQGQNVKGHQAALVGCSRHHSTPTVYRPMPPPRASRYLSTSTNSSLARGGGIVWRPPTQLVMNQIRCRQKLSQNHCLGQLTTVPLFRTPHPSADKVCSGMTGWSVIWTAACILCSTFICALA